MSINFFLFSFKINNYVRIINIIYNNAQISCQRIHTNIIPKRKIIRKQENNLRLIMQIRDLKNNSRNIENS